MRFSDGVVSFFDLTGFWNVIWRVVSFFSYFFFVYDSGIRIIINCCTLGCWVVRNIKLSSPLILSFAVKYMLSHCVAWCSCSTSFQIFMLTELCNLLLESGSSLNA
jgi:hypothetical protein